MKRQAIEDLEKSLLDSNARYAGCGLALLLVLGQRVLVANVGNCRAVMCTPPKSSGEGQGQAPSPKDPWKIRLLVGGGPSGQALADVVKLERLRRLKEYAPLDFEGKPGDVLSGCSGWICAFALPRRDVLARGVAGQGVSNDILSRSGSSTLSNGNMAVLAFIADTTTPNGKALVQLVTETDATETLGSCWLGRSSVTIDQES
eukprot:s11_g13.t1